MIGRRASSRWSAARPRLGRSRRARSRASACGGFDSTVMIGALAAVIGGTVVCGSNTSTLKQTMTAMKAAKAHRAGLISRLDLRVVGDREVGWG
jgi:hypothetical protein